MLLEEVLHYYNDENIISLHSAFHANALIGMIMQWIAEDFSYSPEYMNEQYWRFLKLEA